MSHPPRWMFWTDSPTISPLNQVLFDSFMTDWVDKSDQIVVSSKVFFSS